MMILANIISSAIFQIGFYVASKSETNEQTFKMVGASLYSCGLIVSAVVFLIAVLNIRNFLRQREIQIETASLLRHITAYTLFIVAWLFFVGDVYFTEDGSDSCQTGCQILNLIASITSFISQVVLSFILWDLGRRQPQIAEEEASSEGHMSFNSITIAPFDEEAEL